MSRATMPTLPPVDQDAPTLRMARADLEEARRLCESASMRAGRTISSSKMKAVRA